MISYGFFNSVNGDRLYNAETFNRYFEGLISKDGVFDTVGNGFKVSSGGGLSVNVENGKALVNYRWVINDATETMTLSTAHTLLPRWDMITLRWDSSTRDITLKLTTGTPASSPLKPTPVRSVSVYEIVLAYVYVAAGASVITNAYITDTRFDSSLCGIVTGLINQVDTSTLYNQYLAKFNAIESQLVAWENAQKAQFESWFSTLVNKLQINTYIERAQANYTVTDELWYIQIPNELNYTTSDMLDVYINGVLCVLGVDYAIQENEIEGGYMVKFTDNLQGSTVDQLITFISTRSVIGWEALTDQNVVLTDGVDTLK